ncbi:protein C19orf12 homolog [Dendronephthya gigantea]|uniref:protein C19orf12 homolog n=1 Tax=Dendronephthya gigantea TaxID=151771 RepID=UPI00106C4EA3|nr:protein C19orf12 homolog [Dendronephthya gigantea]
MAGTVRISPDELVDVLAKLAKDNNLQVSVKQSLKGGVIAGTGATVGGLLGGPIGIGVGATIGGMIGAWSTSGTFRSVYSILQELTPIEKEKMHRSIMTAIGDVGLLDLVAFAALIATDQVYKQQMLGAMFEYFKNEFQMEIVE